MGRKSNYEFLVEAGLHPVNAQVLYWMFNHKKGGVARTIEHECRISQPQVSIALNELTAKDWLTVGPIHKETKGRPEKAYWLAKSAEKIISEITGDISCKIDKLYRLKFRLEEWQL